MYYYKIAEVVMKSRYRLPSFEAFAAEREAADVTLDMTQELPQPGVDQHSGTITHRRQPGGWFFHWRGEEDKGLYVSNDYTCLTLLKEKGTRVREIDEWFIRIALECLLARRGYVSLHAAAVEAEGKAVAFSGPSGMGKSTRARAWIEELGAQLINGDRPLIDVRKLELYGVPWDGKEQCFRNVRYPLAAILEVRRSQTDYLRAMGFAQRRKLLMSQSFLPMWDTETAAIQIANIARLAAGAEIVRAFSGPDGRDARAVKDALQNHEYLKEEKDMKAKDGFVLRNVVGEYILMPVGDNIAKFKGTILLNEVSALVWEKLQNPISKADLLQAILDEFEVERAVAAADLDVLLTTLRSYGVIEEG